MTTQTLRRNRRAMVASLCTVVAGIASIVTVNPAVSEERATAHRLTIEEFKQQQQSWLTASCDTVRLAVGSNGCHLDQVSRESAYQLVRHGDNFINTVAFPTGTPYDVRKETIEELREYQTGLILDAAEKCGAFKGLQPIVTEASTEACVMRGKLRPSGGMPGPSMPISNGLSSALFGSS
ncbi:hypothetical protein ACFPVT_01915 [Corynebacterium choanae]|uniref:Uncharacterized protein n=1 Tax=Corynebacterium choanae TaxID=1862358 RepID=A0A3G6J856_9CORY|nr:hypothetical protein [Corynebacterium choanae]AZA12630.1 hypothetical protein CCHOA_01010 [Corynebacterium choanae]